MRLTLFGVELYAKHIVMPNARDKAYAVIGDRCHRRIAQRLDIERVRKVKIGIRGDAVKDRRWSGHVGLIPAHMGDFEDLPLDIGKTVREPPDAPLQNVHAFMAAKFFAFGHQQLQAEADAQVWASRTDEFKHWFEEVMLTKLCHTVPEGSLPRQHDGVRARDVLGALRDVCRVSDTFERLVHTAQIANATIHDGDHRLQLSLRREHAMDTRIQGTGLAHRPADTFENRLGDVMAIGAVLQVDVQGEPAATDQSLEEFLYEFRRKAGADTWAWEGGMIDQIRPGADVERDRHQRLIHRHHRMAKALDAFLRPQGPIKGFSKTDAHVFDGVMVIDIEITTGVEVEVKKPIACERGEHMVEERNAGVDVADPTALKRECDLDICFLGRA